jgi:hypothetical protein
VRIQSTPSHNVYRRSILILSYLLRLSLPSVLFPFRFPNQNIIRVSHFLLSLPYFLILWENLCLLFKGPVFMLLRIKISTLITQQKFTFWPTNCKLSLTEHKDRPGHGCTLRSPVCVVPFQWADPQPRGPTNCLNYSILRLLLNRNTPKDIICF